MQVRRLLISNSCCMAFPPWIFLLILFCYFSFRVNSLEVDSPDHKGHSTFSNNTDRSRMASEATSLLNFAILDTPLGNVTHQSHLSVAFRASDKDRWLNFTLEPNPTIVSNSAQVTHVTTGGTSKCIKSIKGFEINALTGSVWVDGTGNGWDIGGCARIYFWKDGADLIFEGTYSVQEVIHDIRVQVAGIDNTCDSDRTFREHGEKYTYSASGSSCPSRPSQRSNNNTERCKSRPLDRSEDLKTHVPYRDVRHPSSHSKEEGKCSEPIPSPQSVYPWDLRSTIGDTVGCPSINMIASVGIATDCSYTALFNSVSDVVQNVVGMVNSASGVFERSFNITLRLSDLEISEGTCSTPEQEPRDWNMPCSNRSLLDRLDKFSIWRATRADENAFWTLITGCPGTGIGVAWVGQLCNTVYDQSRGTGANLVVGMGMGREWQVFAYVYLFTFSPYECSLHTNT